MTNKLITNLIIFLFLSIHSWALGNYQEIKNTKIQTDEYVCFEAGTKILTPNNQKINIEEIKVGDTVISYNQETNKFENKQVISLIRKKSTQLVYLTLSSNKLIRVTPDHPFQVIQKGWVEAGKLNINDKLLTANQEEIYVKNLEIKDEVIPVFNLEIEDNHTYIAENIVVHNEKCTIGFQTYEIKNGKVFTENGRELTVKEKLELFRNNAIEGNIQASIFETINQEELYKYLTSQENKEVRTFIIAARVYNAREEGISGNGLTQVIHDAFWEGAGEAFLYGVKTGIVAGVVIVTLGNVKIKIPPPKGTQINVLSKNIQYVEHGLERAVERSFTEERIYRVISEGTASKTIGKYGTQTLYKLGDNTVVISNQGRNAGKIITTFSNQTINGVKGGWVEP